jgi:hypothetical protein
MTIFLVDLWLDGYNSEAEMEAACNEFIYDQLNMTASGVTIKPIVFDPRECLDGSMEEAANYVECNETLRKQLAEKVQRNLLLSSQVTQLQKKLQEASELLKAIALINKSAGMADEADKLLDITNFKR